MADRLSPWKDTSLHHLTRPIGFPARFRFVGRPERSTPIPDLARRDAGPADHGRRDLRRFVPVLLSRGAFLS
jgi:hypothetical protein